MRDIKKVIITLSATCSLMVVLFSGIAVYAHTHAYSHMGPVCIGSSPAGVHQYVVATHTDKYGHVTYEYGSCQQWFYDYAEYDKCGCGSTINYHSYRRTAHMSCGQ